MIDKAYLDRVAADISNRVTTVMLNDQEIPIKSVKHEASRVIVITEMTRGITRINSVRLLDDLGNLITQRTPHINVVDTQQTELIFEFEVKGVTS